MGSWVWIGFIAFFVASLSVGIRLLLLWRRTRALPELLIGIGVLGIGPVGFGASMLPGALVDLGFVAPGSLAARLPFAIGSLSVTIGIFSKCVFNWRVYHARSVRVKALVVGVGVLLAALLLFNGLVRGFTPTTMDDAPGLLQSALQVGALFWGSLESLRYWALMRRRRSLGLADPVITNRFLLWSIGAGAAGMGTAVGCVAGLLMQVPALQIPWVVASSSLHGIVAAVALWLAFLPPWRYLQWLRDGSDFQAQPSFEG